MQHTSHYQKKNHSVYKWWCLTSLKNMPKQETKKQNSYLSNNKYLMLNYLIAYLIKKKLGFNYAPNQSDIFGIK